MRYAKVDASTLRVFALGTVGVSTVPGSTGPVQIATPQAGHGTGFAIEPDLIVTAQHVINGARHVVIRRPGKGGFLPARVVYSNEDEDIAILHVDAKLPKIKMRGSDYVLRVRQTVYAVGYPLDPARTQAQSARGIIAGHLESTALQLDMSLNPGNSGGPLVDEKDMVVGMVISRGDPKKGVQGIGLAVPVRKLRLAVARAHREITAGNVAPLSEHDAASAEIVDELIRSGTLAVDDQVAVAGFDHGDLEKRVDQLVSKLNDSDLLVFFAGNLWNTALAIKQHNIRAVGGKTLSPEEADELSRDLKEAAIKLTRRGEELDHSIHKRSRFVELALAADDVADAGSDDAPSAADDDDDNDDNVAASSGDPWDPGHALTRPTPAPALAVVRAAKPATSRSRLWTLQTYPDVRLAAGDTTFGGELALARKLVGGGGERLRWFGSLGASGGLAVGDAPMTAAHSFAAVEAGAGLSVAVGRSSALELYAGIAPSYYSISPDIHSAMTRQSDFVLDHFRATASLALGWLNVSSGVRSISSTLWVEPIGLGVRF